MDDTEQTLITGSSDSLQGNRFSYGSFSVEPVDYSQKVLRTKIIELESSSYASIWSHVRRPPRDYRTQVIFCTLFCFFPTGLLSLYFSNKVTYHYANHDLTAAYRASRTTKYLLMLTSFIGLMTWFTGFFLLIHLQETRH